MMWYSRFAILDGELILLVFLPRRNSVGNLAVVGQKSLQPAFPRAVGPRLGVVPLELLVWAFSGMLVLRLLVPGFVEEHLCVPPLLFFFELLVEKGFDDIEQLALDKGLGPFGKLQQQVHQDLFLVILEGFASANVVHLDPVNMAEDGSRRQIQLLGQFGIRDFPFTLLVDFHGSLHLLLVLETNLKLPHLLLFPVFFTTFLICRDSIKQKCRF